MVLRIVVEGQSLRWYGRSPKIADDSIEFVQFQFDLPVDWLPLEVTAQFTQEKTYNMLLSNGMCYLPKELTAGSCKLSLFGYSGGESLRATTVPLEFTIEDSGFVSSAETPIPPTPDLYAQLIQQLSQQGVLPPVTERDNGKMLLVENSRWGLVPSSRFVKNKVAVTSFTATPGQVEMGITVDSVKLDWDVNMEIVAVTLDGEAIDTSKNTLTLNELSLKSTRTWTLKVTDDQGESATKSASVSFLNGIYYGASAAPETLDSDFVLALQNKVLSSSRGRTIDVNAAPGQHIWYALPARLGTCRFTVGGFEGGFDLAATMDFTNAKGYTESYYIYRSGQTGLGETKVVIS